MKLRPIVTIASLAVVLTGVGTIIGVATTRASSTPITSEWLGDSFTSGWGLPGNTGACQVSTSSWPYQAMSDLAGSSVQIAPNPVFGACGGDTTAQVASEIAPGTKADLVGFTFGGDDVGFSSTLTECIAADIGTFVTGTSPLQCPSDSTVRSNIESDLAAKYGGYQGFLNFMASNYVVEGGNMVVLGYPALMEESIRWHEFDQIVGLCNGITPTLANLMRGWAGLLNQTIGEAVLQFNSEPPAQRDNVEATFVNVQDGGSSADTNPNLFDPAGTNVGHNLCGSDEWLNNFDKLDFSAHWIHPIGFHPNLAGHIAMGHLAASAIEQMDWSRLANPAPSAPPATSTSTTQPLNATPPTPPSSTTTSTTAVSTTTSTSTTTTTPPTTTTTTTTTTAPPQAPTTLTLTADGLPAYGSCPSQPPPSNEKWCGANVDSCATAAFWVGGTDDCTNPIQPGMAETVTCWASGSSVNNSESAVSPGSSFTKSSTIWVETTNNGADPWMSVLWLDSADNVQNQLPQCG
jgi:hypothetical protein